MASSTWSTLVPSLAETRITSSRGMAEHVLELLDDHVGLGRGQVDLVDDRHDHEALRQREVDVGERLRLDALGGVDHQDGALAGLRGCG